MRTRGGALPRRGRVAQSLITAMAAAGLDNAMVGVKAAARGEPTEADFAAIAAADAKRTRRKARNLVTGTLMPAPVPVAAEPVPEVKKRVRRRKVETTTTDTAVHVAVPGVGTGVLLEPADG